MTTPTNMRQHAQELISQLPSASLPEAIAFLEELCPTANSAHSASSNQQQEQVLLHTIQHRLAPEEQSRLRYLRQQNENETITELEHRELLEYSDRIEQQDAERAEALIQLAKLRNVDLQNLVAQYLLPSASNAI
jgi:hypothetical protein